MQRYCCTIFCYNHVVWLRRLATRRSCHLTLTAMVWKSWKHCQLSWAWRMSPSQRYLRPLDSSGRRYLSSMVFLCTHCDIVNRLVFYRRPGDTSDAEDQSWTLIAYIPSPGVSRPANQCYPNVPPKLFLSSETSVWIVFPSWEFLLLRLPCPCHADCHQSFACPYRCRCTKLRASGSAPRCCTNCYWQCPQSCPAT